jgi:hypothetical protein
MGTTFDEVSLPRDSINFMAFNKVIFDEVINLRLLKILLGVFSLEIYFYGPQTI